MRIPIPAYIETLHPYVPGKPIEETERELGISGVIKLASNENPLGPSPKACQAMQRALSLSAIYPDAAGYHLKRAIARKHGVEPAAVVLGNGSNELIDLLIRTFMAPGDRALLARESFLMYAVALQAAGRAFTPVPMRRWHYDLEAMADALDASTRLVFIANPDNPTGTLLRRDALVAFLQRVQARAPQTLVVMDEAYIDFADDADRPDSIALQRDFDNLVTLRTFSKSHGLAGLRIGYGVLAPALANYIDRVRLPFNVSHLAQAAGLAALDDEDHLQRTREHNAVERRFVSEALALLDVEVVPSQANFILIDTHRPSAPLFEAMLRRGIILRPVANYGLPTSLRISLGTRAQNERMLAALGEVLAGHP